MEQAQAPRFSFDPALWAVVVESILANRAAFEAGERVEALQMRHQAGGIPIVLRLTVEQDQA